jgi:hypothetical protein
VNHPELIAVPILMLADYALTILGAKSSAAVYRKHFLMPSYELNPLWRRSVDQVRWFNPRHTALVVLLTAILVLLDQAAEVPDSILELLIGMLLGAFGSVCGRHLTNLLLFGYLNRHPEEISGQVRLSMILILKISQFTYIGLIPIFGMVVALVPNAYTAGVLLGLLSIVFGHSRWARKATRAEVQPERPVQEV